MPDLESQILIAISRKSYQPLKPKALAREIGVPQKQFGHFRRVLRELFDQGRAELGKNQTVRAARPHGTITGIYRQTSSGLGFVRPHPIDGKAGLEVLIRPGKALDAVTGDEVLVRVTRKPSRPGLGPAGEVSRVLERATRQFVGTYFERDGVAYVRVDGAVFSHSVYVGDPGAKGARPDDKVVIEMVRFPTADDRGEAVISEILGPRGKPGVDTLSIIRSLGLPDTFSEDALEEARRAAAAFDEDDLAGREDFTADTVVTIDPVDARDFDDAVSVTQDPRSKHWQLTVHIADVGHFAPPGGALDREARRRGTSVYLPQRVLPMFPEIISNHLASLQQGRLRYVKSVRVDLTAAGQITAVRFAEGAIKVRKRLAYEQVAEILAESPESDGRETAKVEPEVRELLFRMRDLALLLHRRRVKRGALELNMPEVELEYDDQGRVAGGHFVKHDLSHQIVEEFMLTANEAVAAKLDELRVPFLRRIHPAPEPTKLEAFAGFARSLGYKMDSHLDRFALQRVLQQSSSRPDVYAVNYALLRSLKQAVYAPADEGHYALASETYCHFTSPIRRYPDLTVHRLLGRWLNTGRAGSDETELQALGEHCSKTERRAALAERELIKVKLLSYMSQQIGTDLAAIVTGVADYGFFAQAESLPVEGLVHITTLTDDYYYYEETTHSLTGKRTQRRYRLGDRVKVKVVRVDLQRRQMDFRVLAEPAPVRKKTKK